MRIFKYIWTFIDSLPRRYSIGGAIIIIALGAIGIHLVTRSAASTALPPTLPHVQIASIASLSSPAGPLPVTGKVISLSNATILSQSSGEIVSLSHVLGDHIAAGGVIAAFDSSAQQAAVQQAQGAYAGALAGLAKAQGSTAVNSSITSSQATTAAGNAQKAVAAALQSAYASLDDAVHAKADVLFTNPRSSIPVFGLVIPDSQLAVNIVSERVQVETVLKNAKSLTDSASDTDSDTAITTMVAHAQTIAAFLNDAIVSINQAQPSQSVSSATLVSYQTSLGTARTEVVAVIASLNTAKTAYDAAQSGAQTAANSATGGTDSDIAVAQANVQQALGALNGAKANLEKSIIRSPISGTIVSLAITQGDYVSAFSKVADVSNPNALEVQTYVTSSDAKMLSVGGKALISGTVSGTIVSIAPALDPTTNKIEVKVGITGDQSMLTDGETVTVSLDRATTPVMGAKKANNTSNASIVIPIVAAKITPNGPVVFTVSSSTLVASPITLGPIVGDQVTVTSGLTPLMDIVTDARGLSDGQVVAVDTK